MNYTLHQLRVFVKVCETESITKAAEELYLTQPAVSIQLKNFQTQFGIPLIEVIGRKLYVTDFGKDIAKAVYRMLDEAEAINYKKLLYKGLLAGKLRISVVSTAKYIIPYLLADFLKMHPDIDLVLDVTNRIKVIESIQENTVDFSLVSILPKEIKVNKVELMQNKLCLIGNSAENVTGTLNDITLLQNLPLIYREKGSGTRCVMETFFEKQKIQIAKKMELTSNEAVKQAVIAGLGYSIMPLIGIKNELSNQILHIVPVKGLPIESTWNLIWPADKPLSPVASSFLNYIKQEKSKLIEKYFGGFG